MKDYVAAQRYARGFSAAVPDTDRLAQAVDQLTDLADVFRESTEFRQCLLNDAIDEDVRANVLSGVLDRLGAGDEVRRLVRLLLERDREPLMPDIADELRKVLDARLNRAPAQVRSAQPLGPDEQARVTQALSTYTGKMVHAEFGVDPELIGGVVAELEGTVVDGSLRAQLERLKRELIAEEI